MQANTSPPEDLKPTPKQDRLIAALLARKSIVVAAATAGCNEATAHAWLKLPHVQKAYRDAQQTLFDESLRSLMVVTDKAIATLTTLMEDTAAPHGTRARCAQILLEQSIVMHKNAQIEEQIAALDERIEERLMQERMNKDR